MDVGARLAPRTRAIALALILVVALALRLHGVGFGLPALNDPDELMFEMGSVRMLSGPTLNPGWFGHPATTTIYLLAVLNALVFAGGWVMGWWPNPDAFAERIYFDPSWVILPGRLAMVGFALWSIWLTWRLARDLAGERVGLAAAAVLAVNPVHIGYSQIIRSDIMAVCFMLLVLISALRIARGAERCESIRGAVWLGLAIVTKWPFAVTGAAIAGAHILRLARGEETPRDAVRRLATFGLLALAFGLLASPFLLLDYPMLLRNLQGEAQLHHLGATGGGPLFNAGWYLSGPILKSVGWAGAPLCAWGAVLMARRRESLAVLVPVAVIFFALFCVQRLIWERWALPLTPLLSIAVALGLMALLDTLNRRVGPATRRAIAGAALTAVLLPQVAQALADAHVRTHDTRQLAAAWVKAHVPPGDTILVEHFAFDILQGHGKLLFPIGDAGCIDVHDLLSGKTQYDQIENARDQRSNVDYGTLNPVRRDTCGMDWAVLTQYGRYAAEKQTFPRQYAAYVDLLRRGTVVAAFDAIPGERGGPPVTIVRFPERPRAQAGKLPPLRR